MSFPGTNMASTKAAGEAPAKGPRKRGLSERPANGATEPSSSTGKKTRLSTRKTTVPARHTVTSHKAPDKEAVPLVECLLTTTADTGIDLGGEYSHPTYTYEQAALP